MALTVRVLGKSTPIDITKIEKEITPLLVAGESLQKAYIKVRDFWVFTTMRLITVEKFGLTAKMTKYYSLPLKNVFRFSFETSSHTDFESQLSIWTVGLPGPLTIKFYNKSYLFEIQTLLASPLVE